MTRGEVIFRTLVPLVGGADVVPDSPVAGIAVAGLVARWLDAGPAVATGADRADLEALCRQIDVRRRVSVGYAPGWKRLDPEVGATPAVIAGLIAVLLANAGTLGGTDPNGDGGWGLKCANSALKALDQFDDLPEAPALRAWAMSVVDDRTGHPS